MKTIVIREHELSKEIGVIALLDNASSELVEVAKNGSWTLGGKTTITNISGGIHINIVNSEEDCGYIGEIFNLDYIGCTWVAA